MAKVIKIGIPKGSLQEQTLALFSAAGYSFRGSERSLRLSSNDAEIEPVLLRPQEIPVFVSRGDLDCGLAGRDWIEENQSTKLLHKLADLQYSKQSFRPVKWVLAVPEDSPYKSIEDLKTPPPGKEAVRVSTELKNVTLEWLYKRGIFASVDFSWGATEAKAGEFADAIVECTETGASLRANRLRTLGTVFESTTWFFAYKPICVPPQNPEEEGLRRASPPTSRSDIDLGNASEQEERSKAEFRQQLNVFRTSGWKRTKLEGIALLLKSCLAADAQTNVRVLAPSLEAEVLEALIPSTISYSIWNGKKDEVLFDVVMDKASVRELVPVFARNGATRITSAKLDMLYE